MPIRLRPGYRFDRENEQSRYFQGNAALGESLSFAGVHTRENRNGKSRCADTTGWIDDPYDEPVLSTGCDRQYFELANDQRR